MLNERERLQYAHSMWRLAAQHAAGEIAQIEYKEKFRTLLDLYVRAFSVKKPSVVASARYF